MIKLLSRQKSSILFKTLVTFICGSTGGNTLEQNCLIGWIKIRVFLYYILLACIIQLRYSGRGLEVVTLLL